jgi:hypothetical protein
MKAETYELNKTLILSAMANIDAWEKWTEAALSGSVKTLNLSLIRLTKGLVKAWRVFVSDQTQSDQSFASSREILPPSQQDRRPSIG